MSLSYVCSWFWVVVLGGERREASLIPETLSSDSANGRHRGTHFTAYFPKLQPVAGLSLTSHIIKDHLKIALN